MFKFYNMNQELHILNDENNTEHILKHMEFICSLANLWINKNPDDEDMSASVGVISHISEDCKQVFAPTEFRFYTLEQAHGDIELFHEKLLINCYPTAAYIITNNFHYNVDVDEINLFVIKSHDALEYIDYYSKNIFDEKYLSSGGLKLLTDVIPKYGTEIISKIETADGTFRHIYVAKDYRQILLFEQLTLLENLNNKYYYPKIKKCLNCGRYFIVNNRSNVKYCTFPAPQNKQYRCCDPQINILYGKSATETEIKVAYRRIYAALSARVNRHPNNNNYAISFDDFKRKSDERRDRITKGRYTDEEYLQWLKEYCY